MLEDILATKLKMLVRDIECNMGADEYVEWIAYYQLQNDEFKGDAPSEDTS